MALLNRPSAKDFHVPATTVAFTEEHLKTHLQFFNKEMFPEYFTDFEHKGLTYVRTCLIEELLLARIKADTFGNQKYRPTKNKKFNDINESVDTEGVDLRKKPLQAVVTLDEDGNIVSVDFLFNGNTLNQVLDSKTLQNRLVAIYVKNSNFSIANLIEIGANQNSLEKPFGTNDEKTLEHCLREIIEAGGYPIAKEPTNDEIQEWVIKLKASMTFMGNGYDMDSAKADGIINDILTLKLKKTVARTIKDGTVALEEIRKIGYTDTPTVKYGCIGAFKKGVYPHFLTVYSKYSDPALKGTTDYFDFSRGRYEVIIHGGAPDMSDPINWFFTKYLKFWKEWNELNTFVSPTFAGNADMRIIGAYQPLECLNHIWPMDTVVSFEDIIEYYENNKSNLGAVIDTDNDDFDVNEVFGDNEDFDIAA